ncbi:hypothetical protein [Candidatus Neptunichlamydia sp. REUL1]|uniref:hypothetical protein n=1 Tax=Candidatus Neptunichlamydia sp. REUL1 TaxID=3064277 RepID=UPI00292E4781|nr:hypothetical protein [Candidatus Neptunochlamydia sp. REUL1]
MAISVRDRIRQIDAQCSEDKEVKSTPPRKDSKTPLVVTRALADSPPSSVDEKPAEGRFKNKNLEVFQQLKSEQYGSKQIRAFLRSKGIFQGVKEGSVQLSSYVVDIKTQINADYNQSILGDLNGRFSHSLVKAALKELAIDRFALDSGEAFLSDAEVSEIESKCQSIQKRKANVEKLQDWLDPLETVYGSEYVHSLLIEKGMRPKHYSGEKGIKGDLLKAIQEEIVEAKTAEVLQRFDATLQGGDIDGLLKFREQLLILNSFDLPKTEKQIVSRGLDLLDELQQLLDAPKRIFGEISRLNDEVHGEGVSDFYAFYGWNVAALAGDREEHLEACQSFLKTGCRGILTSRDSISSKFQAQKDRLEAKVISGAEVRQPYFAWMGRNKQYNVTQYEQTQDMGAVERTSYGSEKRHYICQSLSMQQAGVIAGRPDIGFEELDLRSTDQTIQLNKQMKSDRYDQQSFESVGLRQPKDPVRFKTKHSETATIQQKLETLEGFLDASHGLALLNLDPPPGSTDLGHSLMMQIDNQRGIYRFIDAGVGSFDFRGDKEAFYRAVTELAATMYYTTPHVTLIPLRS